MSGSWITLVMLALVFVAFYFFGIRPQKKQEQEANNMRNSLTIGDEITTIGGIIGRVVKITDETVVIETSKERTKLHILKNAIRSVDVHAADTVEAAAKAEKQAEKQTEKNEKH
ncbi:MAG: preprotein translocase subunit YajC [Ruminococcaceae bacterium]|nr:preprotein translocase subunit YajC [Oscillospiraceae bacterium]